MTQSDTIPRPARPEFVRDTLDASNIGEIIRPLSAWERISNITGVRRVFILVVLALIWQAYAVPLDNPLIFPTFTETVQALWTVTASG